jgi:hypothetical protein
VVCCGTWPSGGGGRGVVNTRRWWFRKSFRCYIYKKVEKEEERNRERQKEKRIRESLA